MQIFHESIFRTHELRLENRWHVAGVTLLCIPYDSTATTTMYGWKCTKMVCRLFEEIIQREAICKNASVDNQTEMKLCEIENKFDLFSILTSFCSKSYNWIYSNAPILNQIKMVWIFSWLQQTFQSVFRPFHRFILVKWARIAYNAIWAIKNNSDIHIP